MSLGEDRDVSVASLNYNDFSKVLDVPLLERYKESIFLFFSKIHQTKGVTHAISMVFMVLTLMCITLPSLMINNQEIWGETTIVIEILKYMSFAWQGLSFFGGNAELIFCCILLGVIIIIWSLVTYFAFQKKIKRFIQSGEYMVILVATKYLFCAFFPWIVSSIGNCVNSIIAHDSIFGIVLVSIIVVFIPVFLYHEISLISPRLIFSDDPLQGWLPTADLTIILDILVQTSVGSSVKYFNTNWKVAAAFIICITSCISAFFVSKYSLLVLRKNQNLLVACMVTAAVTSLFVGIMNFVFLNSYLIILVAVIAFIFSYFVVSLYSNKVIANSIDFIENLCNLNVDMKSPKQFIFAVRSTIEVGHPSLFSWVPFERITYMFPHDKSVLLLYIRLLVSSPSLSTKLLAVSETTMKSGLPFSRAYYHQSSIIIRNRQKNLSPDMVNEFKVIENQIKTLMLSREKLWGTIIEGNTQSFWGNVESYIEIRDSIDTSTNVLTSLLNKAPVIIEKAIEIHRAFTYNYQEIRRLEADYEVIIKNDNIGTDIPYYCFVSTFPGIAEYVYCDETDAFPSFSDCVEKKGENLPLNWEPVHHLINASKLGKNGCITIWLILISIVLLIILVLYDMRFSEGAAKIMIASSDLLSAINKLMYDFAEYSYEFTTSKILNETGRILKNDNATMQLISPNWWKLETIPRFYYPEQTLLRARQLVFEDLAIIQKGIALVKTSNEANANFFAKYELNRYKNTTHNLPNEIFRCILETERTLEYVNDTYSVFQELKQMVTSYASELDFSKEIEPIANYFIIFTIVLITFFVFPLFFQIFRTGLQIEDLAEIVETIPSKYIRKLLNRVENTDEKNDKRGNLEEQCALLRSKGSTQLSFTKALILMVCFVPSFVLSVVIYFSSSNYIQNNISNAQSSAFLRTCYADMRFAMMAMQQAFETSDHAIENYFMNLIQDIFKEAQFDNTKSLLMNSGQMYQWLLVEDNYRNKMYPVYEDYDTIPAIGEDWERLSAQKFLHAFDNLFFIISITTKGDFLSNPNYIRENYFIFWAKEAREAPFIALMSEQLKSDMQKSITVTDNIMSVTIVVIIISSFVAIIKVKSASMEIKKGLSILFELDPEAIFGNNNLFNLINNGHYGNVEKQSFPGSNSFIELNSIGMIILDAKMLLIEANELIKPMMANLEGYIEDLFNAVDDRLDMEDFLRKVADLAASKTPKFSTRFMVEKDKEIYTLSAEAIALCKNHVALENETDKINRLVILFRNETNAQRVRESIKKNHERILEIMKNVLPIKIFDQLQKGVNTVSNAVHSATIGWIKVSASRRFSFSTNDPHLFYNKVFMIFDEKMQKYPSLVKIRTFAHGYTFAGGIFQTVNRPEKHAEESLKFAIEVLQSLDSISKEAGTEVSLTIGMHTGGPVVAGIMSIDYPSFLVLGKIKDYARLMKDTGKKNEVHITRSVYELVYSSNFRIIEGETAIYGKEKIETYDVLP